MQADSDVYVCFSGKMERIGKYNMPEGNLGILGRQTTSCHYMCVLGSVNLIVHL